MCPLFTLLLHTRKHCPSSLLTWLIACGLLLGSTIAYSGEPAEIKFYTRSNTIGFQPYQADLLTLALEKSRPKYGDYRLSYYNQPLSPARAKMEVQAGNLVNVIFATEWQGATADTDKIIALDFAVLKGLLGLRSFVIQAHARDKLKHINTFEQLQKIKAGQVKSWPDTKVLKYNNIPVVTSDTYGNLFDMLSHKRFDYLPLSILESYSVTEEFQEGGIDLEVAPNVAIFYPLPMFIVVSADTPEIAERIQTGLILAKMDGTFDALFSVHFSNIEKIISTNKQHTFMLQNPNFSGEKNKKFADAFSESYGGQLQLHKPPH